MNEKITLDGSIGGGSVLRVAVPLALGLNKSVHIFNIRKNRQKPGLRNQHLVGLQTLAKITNSNLKGGFVGSSEIEFIPRLTMDYARQVMIDFDTAASVSLVIQAICNLGFVTEIDVEVEFQGGGSHTNWSPTLDYMQRVAKPIFHHFGLFLDIRLDRVGFYPKGGARGKFNVKSQNKEKIIGFNKGNQGDIFVQLVGSDNLKGAQVLERQISQFTSDYKKIYRNHLSSSIMYQDTLSPGTSMTCILGVETSVPKGVSILGKKGVSSEKIAKLMLEELQEAHYNLAAFDKYMGDQLILPLALSPIGSSITIPRITDHVKVNIDLVNRILGKCIEIVPNNDFTTLKRI